MSRLLPYLPFHEGVAPVAVPPEGATRAPLIANRIKQSIFLRTLR
jgi:hypothetical protein